MALIAVIAERLRSATIVTLASRSWTVFSGGVNLILVTTLLSREEQGYYYTFGGLILMQTLLELGFSQVMMQFVSHEWTHLRQTPHGTIDGEEANRQRLGALIALGRRWYLALSVIFLIVVGAIGQLVLSLQPSTGIAWAIPWWLLCACLSISTLTIPLRSVLEGIGRVGDSYRIALCGGIVNSLCCWSAMFCGLKLYAMPLMVGPGAVISLILLRLTIRPLLRIQRQPGQHFDWKAEFLPQQWRVGISWLSGFFIFQSFVPIAFAMRGAVEAGRIGVALQLYSAVNMLATTVLANIQPRFGNLGARGEFRELRQLVSRTIAKGMAMALAFAVLALCALYGMADIYPHYAQRIPPFPVALAFVLAAVGIQIANVETSAVRFQRIDPFYAISLITAALTLASNLALCWLWGIGGCAAGFLIITCVILTPAVHLIYISTISRYKA